MTRTATEAYDRGFAEGSDSSGMLAYWSAWPSHAEIEKPDAIVRAWMRGFSDGEAEKRCRHEWQSSGY